MAIKYNTLEYAEPDIWLRDAIVNYFLLQIVKGVNAEPQWLQKIKGTVL